MSPKNKQKNSESSVTNFQTLCGFLIERGISEAEAIDRITLQDQEPAKDLYRTIVSASQQIQELIRDKMLDLESPYQKSLLRFLELGDKITKTIAAAKMEAYPADKDGDSDIPLGDG